MKSRAVHDRDLLLYGCKRNEVLNLAEIEQYGLDSFAERLRQHLRNATARMVPSRRPSTWSHGC